MHTEFWLGNFEDRGDGRKTYENDLNLAQDRVQRRVLALGLELELKLDPVADYHHRFTSSYAIGRAAYRQT
jgi:hypothetical protein